MSTLGVARKPAAPTSAMKAATATNQALWILCEWVTTSASLISDERTSGRSANMCKNPAMHKVVVLAIEEVVGFDLNIPPLVFSSATRHGQPLYDVRICGVDDQPVRVSFGYSAKFDSGPDVLAEADTVIIPGTRVLGPRRDGTLPGPLADALALIPARARMMSICTGAFVLGAAGILDGRRATTHWAHAEAFRRLYPRVELDEDVLFVDDGDVLTSAGLAAGVDLCLHVVRSDHGSAVANHAARYCVVPPWRDGG